MTKRVRLVSGVVGITVLGAVASHDAGGQTARPTIATDADFRRAMKELSNWGRWGEQDELGAANLITPAKRKQALALAREGRTISLSHDVPQEKAVDTPTFLNRTVVTLNPFASFAQLLQSVGVAPGAVVSNDSSTPTCSATGSVMLKSSICTGPHTAAARPTPASPKAFGRSVVPYRRESGRVGGGIGTGVSVEASR